MGKRKLISADEVYQQNKRLIESWREHFSYLRESDNLNTDEIKNMRSTLIRFRDELHEFTFVLSGVYSGARAWAIRNPQFHALEKATENVFDLLKNETIKRPSLGRQSIIPNNDLRATEWMLSNLAQLWVVTHKTTLPTKILRNGKLTSFGELAKIAFAGLGIAIRTLHNKHEKLIKSLRASSMN